MHQTPKRTTKGNYKTFLCLCICLCLGLLLGCSNSEKPISTTDMDIFIGDWDPKYCMEEKTDLSYLAMTVTKDGHFSIFDTCGNPGISGQIKSLKENKMMLSWEMLDDFTPPTCWEIEPGCELEYEFVGKDIVKLKADNRTIVFERIILK